MPESRGKLRSWLGAAVADAVQKRRLARTLRNREAGQALALTAVTLTILLLAAGLAIDTGVLRYQKRQMQAAADAAAIAAADDMSYSDVQTTATNQVTASGVTNAQVTAGCSASITGSFGSSCNAGTPYVQVTVAKQEPLYFMKIIPGITSPTVSTLATAHYGNGPNCMYALQVSATASVTGAPTGSSATTTLDLNSCGLISNGGINIQACLNTFAASSIGIGQGASSTIASCTPSPQNQPQIAAAASDPIGNPYSATLGACTNGPYSPPNGAMVMPGSYACGILITGNTMVTFASGTYVLGASPTGYALLIYGGGNNIQGSGVTFYSASGQVAICQSQTSQIIANVAPCDLFPASTPQQITLTPPTTGATAGILFYQDPSDTMPATIMGSDAFGTGNTEMEGIFYFPTASLTLAELTDGTSWQTTYNAAVANTLSIIGTVRFGSDYDSLPNGSPIKDAVLVQ